MAQLIDFFKFMTIIYIYLTVIFPDLWMFIFFYPTGIFLSLMIIYLSVYCLTVFSLMIVSIFSTINYYVEFEFSIFYILSKLPIFFLYDLISDFLKNNSDYYFVFLSKKTQFIIFLIFIIIIFF